MRRPDRENYRGLLRFLQRTRVWVLGVCLSMALVMALREAGLAVEWQVPVPVWFRRQKVGDFRADILVEKKVLLELKSSRAIDPAHEAQLLHYLKATEIELGLLLNFGTRPQFRRLLFDNERKKIRGNPCESVAGVSG